MTIQIAMAMHSDEIMVCTATRPMDQRMSGLGFSGPRFRAARRRRDSLAR
jgi:hypothetical protein